MAGPGRGEGSIPVGKANRGLGITTTLTTSTGETYQSTEDATGTFYAPRLTPGIWQATTKGPHTEADSFTIEVATSQTYIFYAGDIPKGLADQVTGITILPSGTTTGRVGDTINFRVRLSGDVQASIRPNLWIDGGVASFRNPNQLVLTTPGSGVLRAKVNGFEAELPIQVEP